MSPAAKTIKSSRRYWPLIFLLLLFIGPLIGAISLYFSGGLFIESTVNSGKLFNPPAVLEVLPLTKTNGHVFKQRQLLGKWLMMYVTPKACTDVCVDNLKKMRQVRVALGKYANRVNRLLVTLPGQQTSVLDKLIVKEYRGTLQAFLNKKAMSSLVKQTMPSAHALQEGHLYVADPLGNIILGYPMNGEPKGLYKDLKRLLRISQIG